MSKWIVCVSGCEIINADNVAKFYMTHDANDDTYKIFANHPGAYNDYCTQTVVCKTKDDGLIVDVFEDLCSFLAKESTSVLSPSSNLNLFRVDEWLARERVEQEETK